jgi:predicted nucleic acid-binding protein
MIRTQIQLTEEQSKTLKEMAQERGVSMAELIRQSIDNFIRARNQLTLEEKRQFETARRLGLDTVFAFDQHFVEQGFTCLS